MIAGRGFFKDTAYGWDGLRTFIFSNLLLVLCCGLGFLWLFFKVCLQARSAPTKMSKDISGNSAWLVAGLCLRNNLPVAEFKVRLDRVVQLMISGVEPEKILILGGMTGNNPVSEAAAGAEYLQQQGVSESLIVLEDQSRHTLENMQHARSMLELTAWGRSSTHVLVISSRYHLHRIITLAQGLGMQLLPVAAEEQFNLNARTCLLILKEAYFLHWYYCGRLWVFITGHCHSRERIS